MRTIELQAYTFSELSDKAKERAIEWYRESMYSYLDLSDEGNEELLIDNGFLEPKIMYSGFSSQGDGACFTARVDKDRFLVGKYECLKDADFSLRIETLSSFYCHERTKRIEAYIYQATEEQDALICELEEDVEELRLDLCQQIYSNLQADYDYQMSDENIIENIVCNEYEFDEQGKVI